MVMNLEEVENTNIQSSNPNDLGVNNVFAFCVRHFMFYIQRLI